MAYDQGQLSTSLFATYKEDPNTPVIYPDDTQNPKVKRIARDTHWDPNSVLQIDQISNGHVPMAMLVGSETKPMSKKRTREPFMFKEIDHRSLNRQDRLKKMGWKERPNAFNIDTMPRFANAAILRFSPDFANVLAVQIRVSDETRTKTRLYQWIMACISLSNWYPPALKHIYYQGRQLTFQQTIEDPNLLAISTLRILLDSYIRVLRQVDPGSYDIVNEVLKIIEMPLQTNSKLSDKIVRQLIATLDYFVRSKIPRTAAYIVYLLLPIMIPNNAKLDTLSQYLLKITKEGSQAPEAAEVVTVDIEDVDSDDDSNIEGMGDDLVRNDFESKEDVSSLMSPTESLQSPDAERIVEEVDAAAMTFGYDVNLLYFKASGMLAEYLPSDAGKNYETNSRVELSMEELDFLRFIYTNGIDPNRMGVEPNSPENKIYTLLQGHVWGVDETIAIGTHTYLIGPLVYMLTTQKWTNYVQNVVNTTKVSGGSIGKLITKMTGDRLRHMKVPLAGNMTMTETDEGAFYEHFAATVTQLIQERGIHHEEEKEAEQAAREYAEQEIADTIVEEKRQERAKEEATHKQPFTRFKGQTIQVSSVLINYYNAHILDGAELPTTAELQDLQEKGLASRTDLAQVKTHANFIISMERNGLQLLAKPNKTKGEMEKLRKWRIALENILGDEAEGYVSTLTE